MNFVEHPDYPLLYDPDTPYFHSYIFAPDFHVQYAPEAHCALDFPYSKPCVLFPTLITMCTVSLRYPLHMYGMPKTPLKPVFMPLNFCRA